jgi:hypothetical protein
MILHQNLNNMKQIILLLAVAITATCFAQQTQNVDSKVSNVTLFLSGAQVTRTAQATLQPGITEITFTGLSESIDANTIRLTGEGNFTIISVNSRVNYLRTQKTIKDEESLKIKKKQLELLLEDIAAQLGVLATEESLLKANQKIGSTEKGTTTLELKSAADFFRLRFTELSEKKLTLSRKEQSTREELDRINEQLGEASKEDVKPTGEIMVQVIAKEPLAAKFKVSYLVRSASWSPEFDLRLDDISQPLELSRRAKISQNSGEEWKDIKLTLSTGNPNESGTEPRLSTWYIGGYRNYLSGDASGVRSSGAGNAAIIEKPKLGSQFNGTISGRIFDAETHEPIPFVNIITSDGSVIGTTSDFDGNYTLNIGFNKSISVSYIGYYSAKTIADSPIINIGLYASATTLERVEITDYKVPLIKSQSPIEDAQNLEIESNNEQQIRSVKEYIISMPMSMPSDGKQYNLVIGGETIKADYEFHAVPKFDRDAFLVAKVVNWQDYDLLDATAGIFYEGTFTGKTKLMASMATDTLDISLGRDKSIMIERKKVKDYTSSQLLGSNRTVQRGWEISLRNNKKQAVTIIVSDQYPISKEKDIEVDLADDGGAQIFKETGILKWNVTLEPGQLKKLKFRYYVKYPKERILTIE